MSDSEKLQEKLAIKPGHRVIVRACPVELHAVFAEAGAIFDRGTIAEITISFVTDEEQILNACREGIALTAPGGTLWMAYPKAFGEGRDWTPFEQAGWERVTTIEIDESWSALRFRPA